MSESRDDPNIFWVDPEVRGILPLETFHISKSLKKTVRRGVFEIRTDSAFADVMRECAAAAEGRKDTWINDEIIQAFIELHRLGVAHSIECWQDGKLAGGLYGVAIGGAFCGESMFTRVRDASKVALVHLVARLHLGGFVLLDTQFVTDHLKRFGAVEIPARDYLERLDHALRVEAEFYLAPAAEDEEAALESVLLQSNTQTS